MSNVMTTLLSCQTTLASLCVLESKSFTKLALVNARKALDSRWIPFFLRQLVGRMLEIVMNGVHDVQVQLYIITAGWKLWPFAHLITYGVVPIEQRLLWVDCVELVWVPIFPDVASTHKSSSKGKQIATPHKSPNKGKQISTLPAMSSAGSQSNVRIDQVDKNATFKPEVWAQIPGI
ncbi:hypothetical protein G4B88_000699 [Cannabis sativa]|uniref:Uncharacterized protein n=1 Tax=Cannabis sativa TaxID=3483 RepID=A0A7J6EP02_CANSA|nr:hypothetical protein G4B88_000699 [Cannabis sativa]